ncbi:Lrp/AsnC family transcriptional regulator [Haloactinospora alba]|uniref:Lrp/AsnC family transcriptional regulator n=1 Tax=Haloactinospora alba TaxID=405555 RepID=UPI00114F750B|nr:Lrp/AsnC family transcriptional regulator [Haloactinospora alba]
MNRQNSLDDVDYLLLGMLQEDATRSLNELGAAAGVSASAVQRRLVRLRAMNVIDSQVAVLDKAAVGIGFTAVTLVELVDDAEANHGAFREYARAEPQVQQCYAIVGQWDYVVVLVTADLAANRELSLRLFVESGLVRRYETLPTSEAVKYGLALPFPADPDGRETGTA